MPAALTSLSPSSTTSELVLAPQEETWEDIYRFLNSNRQRRTDSNHDSISDAHSEDSCSDSDPASSSAPASAPGSAPGSTSVAASAAAPNLVSGMDNNSVHSDQSVDNESVCSSEDIESVYSDTSTLIYGHEPFSTFQERVLDLACKIIWPGANPKEITVDRLEGGGYNRIIGISRRLSDELNLRFHFVLRVPRFESSQIDCEVAALRFVHQHTEIPTPVVLEFDTTNWNPIGSAYMIQNYIPAVNLYDMYLGFDHEGKCRLARELGNVYRQILAVRSSTHGILVPAPGDDKVTSPIHVAPVPMRDILDPYAPHDPLAAKPYDNSAPTQSTLEILTSLIQARKAWRLSRYPNNTIERIYMDQFCTMASELDADGWFSDVPICLAHLDLGPHNILVDMKANDQGPIILGVLDWDSAVLFPMFVACEPPVWLWHWDGESFVDERSADDVVLTPEEREVKQIFEEAAGPDYMRFAYRPEYRLARTLSEFALKASYGTG
ncbi:hypothetical protein F4775DRAFT_606223 [Biscogniauxia sp. FL1348]|nr:hypothetical protein F4775DRAFT_606223 [Biscogniauxia sp. FL1348]